MGTANNSKTYVVTIVCRYYFEAPSTKKAKKVFETMQRLGRKPEEIERTIVCENTGEEEPW